VPRSRFEMLEVVGWYQLLRIDSGSRSKNGVSDVGTRYICLDFVLCSPLLLPIGLGLE